MKTDIKTHRGGFHLEVICVVCVRHQIAVVGALQLEAVCDASIRIAVLAVAVEVGQTFIVAEFLEVLVVLGYSSIAQEFYHTCIIKGSSHIFYKRFKLTPKYIVCMNLHEDKVSNFIIHCQKGKLKSMSVMS